MLRKIRLTFAMICFVLITLLFLDFTGTLHGWFGWLAKIQFLPAVLALNVGVILFLVILTLVCGRIYCSVICPLGVFQDILAWLGRQPKKRRKLPYSYSPALSWLRYGVLGVFIIALLVHWLLYLHPIVHTDVLPIIFFNLYGNGATICLLIWLNGQTVMPFMKRMYG